MAETELHPVLVNDFGIGDNTPLKQNYTRDFAYFVGDDAPRSWRGLVQVVVTDIEFSE